MSSANLDKTMSVYFNGSNSEINYGDVRLSVLTFQDDALRMVDTLQKAQHGNELMSSAMKRKQLTLNIDKCSIIVFGKKAKVESIRNKINRDKSLTLDDKIVKAKEKDEYLGDMLHEAGLAMSAHETVNKRCGKMFSSIIEISSILDDFRIDSLGGLKAGLDIFELALIPALLNNADTWVDLKEDTIQKLDNLQNTMFRYLFAVPKSTPQPIMRFDLGHLSMREKIHVRKLNFLHHLKNLPSDSLGNEFYNLQLKYGFPGLIKEGQNLIRYYGLENILDPKTNFSKKIWSKKVKDAVFSKSEDSVKKEFLSYSKLKDLDASENLKLKEYANNMNLRNARTMFRIRSRMVNVKMNRKSDKKFASELWKCNYCLSIDSQSHIVWCPAFASLREGKNLNDDLDLVNYFQAVMRIRDSV